MKGSAMVKDTGKKSIMIVDDVPKNIQLVAGILQDEGYHMAFAQAVKPLSIRSPLTALI